jgi:hypothetical protein
MGMGLDFLNAKNIARIRQKLVDKREAPSEPLIWLNRTKTVTATDGEITQVNGQSQIWAADIIAADASARINATGTDWSYERTNIAKIKHGFALSESQIQTLFRIEQNAYTPDDLKGFAHVIANAANNLEEGLRQRQEAMILGMLLGNYHYNKLGIKVKGTWNFPTGFNVRVSVPWDDPVNSRPVTNLITMRLNASQRFGKVLNRATMPLASLEMAIESDEFKNRLIAASARSNNFRLTKEEIYTDDFEVFRSILARMTGYSEIETYDGMYREPSNFASNIKEPQRYLPEEKVLLTNTSNNGWDFANGLVMEAIMARLGGSNVIGAIPGGNYGPVTYATQANGQLDPAGYTIWSVQRGAPRRNDELASAVMEVL